jgi:signal transduction histidine kinase
MLPHVNTPSALDRPITLAELLDAAALEEVMRSYADFHGIGLSIVDLGGRVLLASGTMEPLCEAVRDRPQGKIRCETKLGEVRGIRPIIDAGMPAVCECFTGFRYQVQPLLHEGDLLGTVVFGPYQPDARPASLTGVVLSILGPSGLSEAESAAARLRPMSDAQARRTVEQIGHVLGVLLHSAYARHLTAQLHLAAIEDAYKEVADKNRRLGDAVERLQEVDRLKSNFLATVSHELRTPLTSVIGYSEMLLEGLAGPLNDEQREYVHTIMEKGDQLLQLISGILDVSRIEAGSLRIARDRVDIGTLMNMVVAAVQPLAQRKRLEIGTRTVPGAPDVLGDRDKLRQVILNLLGNAIKFTPDGGKIEVFAEVGSLVRENEHAKFAVGHAASAGAPDLGVRLRIRDSGIGIAKEKQLRIFEPFFQVDSSSTREYGGTGLGLTLVKSFVEAHGGHVWVDSELGRGSSFTVTLPAAADALTDYLKAGGVVSAMAVDNPHEPNVSVMSSSGRTSA